MRFFQSLSVKKKLTCITVLMSVVGGVIASSIFIINDTASFRNQMTREAQSYGKFVAANSMANLFFEDEDSAGELLSALSVNQNIVSASLYRVDGSVFAKYHRGEKDFQPPASEEDGYHFSKKDFVLFQSVEMDGSKIGTLNIQYDLLELQERRKNIISIIVVLGVCIGIAVFILLYFVSKIISPLEGMTHVAVEMAGGDFTKQIKAVSKDEVGVLANAFTKMSTGVKGMIKGIQSSSQQITSLAGEMGEKAQKVREGTSHQAESSEKTSASIQRMNVAVQKISESIDSVSLSTQSTSSSVDQMSSTINQLAENANHLSATVEDTASSILENTSSIKMVVENVDVLSASAEEAAGFIREVNQSIKEVGEKAKESANLTEKVSRDVSETGIGAIEKAIQGMEKIKKTVNQSFLVINKLGERTEHIGKILTVIDDVTQETSLLALNAAILAAQAGSEGKGFAVVADEIKELADRTGASTKEIAQLIEDVQTDARDAVESIKEGNESVEEGFQLSMGTRDSLKILLESSKESSEMSRTIESATLQQVKGIGQVTELTEKINLMVQQISAAMRDLGERTHHMSESSENMRSLTHQMKVSTHEQAQGSKEISREVENVTSRIRQVAQAIGEQKQGTEVITEAAREIHDITRLNVEMIQQMNQAVDGLITQSSLLNQEVSRFKV